MKDIYTVKELPPMERPYEKCAEYGPGALSDGELMAVLIKTGTKEKNSIDLAREVLALTPGEEGLAGIYHLTYEQLTGIRGIGPVKAVQILCAGEIAKRLARYEKRKRMEFHSAESIAGFVMAQMRYLEKEEVRILLFDGNHGFICERIISVGTVNMACVSPREVYLEALRSHAVYVILLHNHPSGNPEPSRQDILLTKRMKQAGELLGILLSDHIIIGNQVYYSFKEHQLLFD